MSAYGLSLLVGCQLICLAIAGVPYGYQPPVKSPQCYPKTVYVTVQQDIYNEVPVPTRVYQTKLVPTRYDLDEVVDVYQDQISTRYYPQPVTTTVHEALVDYVTNYKYITVTKQTPVVATVDKNIPAIVTETDYSQVVSVVIDTEIIVETDVLPVYSTKREIVFNQIYNTKVIPIYETVWDTKIVYKTLCGDDNKGYY